MPLAAAVRLAAHLNACRHGAESPEVAARAIRAEDAAHHVIDAESLLGLTPDGASELEPALSAALLFHAGDWALAVPRPGAPGPLSGPAPLTTAAIAAGAVVLPDAGGAAWLPGRVGPAIQWTVAAAGRPRLTDGPAEADRWLSEVVLETGRTLADLPLGPGADRDGFDLEPLELPNCYGSWAQRSAQRAWMLLTAVDVAREDTAGILHTHAIEVRSRALGEIERAAIAALCAAVSWTGR